MRAVFSSYHLRRLGLSLGLRHASSSARITRLSEANAAAGHHVNPTWSLNLSSSETTGSSSSSSSSSSALAALREVATDAASSSSFDLVLDARSPAEHALDHIPGSISRPVLSDEEHAQVGTLYRTCSFTARRTGAALASRNIGRVLTEEPLRSLGRQARVLVYCFRGGQRSQALATVLSRVGWEVAVLNGGYRAYRATIREALDELGAGGKYVVIDGPTGSGKTAFLDELRAAGGQVLDLEGCANHFGSALGERSGGWQPSQRRMDSRVASAAMSMDLSKPIFVESESRRIGGIEVPAPVFNAFARRPVLRVALQVPLESRVRHILSRYAHHMHARGQAMLEAGLLKLPTARGWAGFPPEIKVAAGELESLGLDGEDTGGGRGAGQTLVHALVAIGRERRPLSGASSAPPAADAATDSSVARPFGVDLRGDDGWTDLVRGLLVHHYDPSYARARARDQHASSSLSSSSSTTTDAERLNLDLADCTQPVLRQAAHELLSQLD